MQDSDCSGVGSHCLDDHGYRRNCAHSSEKWRETILAGERSALQLFMQLASSAHFVSFAQAILYRGVGFGVVWQDFAAVLFIGMVFFIGALMRFRKTVSEVQ